MNRKEKFSKLKISSVIFDSAAQITDLMTRRLTEDEIESIIRLTPLPLSPIRKIAEKARQEIMKVQRQVLSTEAVPIAKITPENLARLGQMYVQTFNVSRVHPGTPVALAAAGANGQTPIQAALNIFKHGSTQAANRYDTAAFVQLFQLFRRSSPTLTIHFLNKNMTINEVLAARRDLVGVTIQTLLKSSQIFSQEEKRDVDARGWWYPTYLSLYPKRDRITTQRNFIRLFFDVQALYTYGVSTSDIVARFEYPQPRELVCVPSPTNIGIVDVYPQEGPILAPLQAKANKAKTFFNVTAENMSLLFIRLILLPRLNNYLLKGIPGLLELFAVTTPTWSIVRFEEPLPDVEKTELWRRRAQELAQQVQASNEETIAAYRAELDRVYYLWIDQVRSKFNGVSITKLSQLLELNGIRVLEASRERLRVVSPNERTPKDIVQKALDAEEKSRTAEEKRLRTEGQIFPELPRSPLLQAGYYVNAEANGTNLQDLLAYPGIDPKLTSCNIPLEMFRLFDIEACRNFLIKEINEFGIHNGNTIDARHISVLVDMMVSIGVPIPINSRGAARQNLGALSLSAFDQAMDVYVNTAAVGKKEAVNTTATCVFTGQRIPLGTGSFKLAINEQLLRSVAPQAEIKVENKFDLGDEDLNFPNPVDNGDLTQFNQTTAAAIPTKPPLPNPPPGYDVYGNPILAERLLNPKPIVPLIMSNPNQIAPYIVQLLGSIPVTSVTAPLALAPGVTSIGVGGTPIVTAPAVATGNLNLPPLPTFDVAALLAQAGRT